MSLWSIITGTTPQDEQQANLDKEQQQFNDALDRRAAAGTISDEKAQQLRDYGNGVTLEDTDAAARAGFQEGLAEGYHNVLAAPGNVVGAVGKSAGELLSGIFKNVPWWIYLGAAGALFFYLSPILMPLLSAAVRRVTRK